MQIGKCGQEILGDEKVFAEKISGAAQSIYKVLTYNNFLYDPLGTDSNRESLIELKLKNTDQKVFDLYTKYLKTRNKSFFLQAQRGFANG